MSSQLRRCVYTRSSEEGERPGARKGVFFRIRKDGYFQGKSRPDHTYTKSDVCLTVHH